MVIDNIRIANKVAAMVALFSAVFVAAVIMASLSIRHIDRSYDDLVNRVDKSAFDSAQVERLLDMYISNAYQLAAETSQSGNKQLLAAIKADKEQIAELSARIGKNLPEQADTFAKLQRKINTTFLACSPAIEDAGKSDSESKIVDSVSRLKVECDPLAQTTTDAISKFNQSLHALTSSQASTLAGQTRDSIRSLVLIAAAGIIISVAIALWVSLKGLSAPITRLRDCMEQLAANQMIQEVPGTRRRDEVGEMARTVEVFKTNALEVERLRADQEAQKLHAAEEQRRVLNELAQAFENRIMDVVGAVSSSSTQLQGTAQSMSAAASQSDGQAQAASTAAEQASANVQTVATATEELSASIGEISRQVAESARISQAASDEAARTNQLVQNLAQAADRIGQVVNLINDIAAQTNLLALNATIEAARAGDAGKGFAVVAGEVKHLANQTAKATDEISAQIGAVQTETRQTVEAISGIAATIAKVSEISSNISSAVEEQGAATQEIARNVQQAAQGTQTVHQNIGGVSESAASTGAAAQQVLASAANLAGNADRLRREVATFLSGVRTS